MIDSIPLTMPSFKDPDLTTRIKVWTSEKQSSHPAYLMAASDIADACREVLMPEGIIPDSAITMRSLLNKMSVIIGVNYDANERFTNVDLLACLDYALKDTIPAFGDSTHWRRTMFINKILPVLLQDKNPQAYTLVKHLYDEKVAQHEEDRSSPGRHYRG